jgi:hypothetical protein
MIILQEQVHLLQGRIFPGLLLHPHLILQQALLPLLLRALILLLLLQVCNFVLISPLILFSSSPFQLLLPISLLLVSIRWFFVRGCRKLLF